MTFDFFVTNIFLGVALAMDAFSVSLANGLSEPAMKTGKMNLISGTFGFFQWLMPMVGWICVHTIVEAFSAFKRFIPWIALILLAYIGIKMIIDGLKNRDGEAETPAVGFSALMIQAVATSIDALSVGFTIAEYNLVMALTGSLVIGIVTYGICMAGLSIGKKAGTKLAWKANILGGSILIIIGLKIFIEGVF